MPFLTDLAFERQDQIRDALSRLNEETSDNARLLIVKQAIDGVKQELSRVTIAKFGDEIKVKNLDEVKLHLRTELSKAVKPLISAIEKLGVSQFRIENLMREISLDSFEVLNKFARLLNDDFNTFLIQRPSGKVSIDNFQDLSFPSDFKISNLSELNVSFERLAGVIKETFDIPAPLVTVQPPEVIVPAITIPEIKIPDIILPEGARQRHDAERQQHQDCREPFGRYWGR